MEQDKLFKKMFDFQKASFDNSYKAMSMIRVQGEKFVESMVSYWPWVPEEGKNAMKEWNELCQKNSDDFKEMMDNNFQKMEDLFFAESAKSGAKAKKTA